MCSGSREQTAGKKSRPWAGAPTRLSAASLTHAAGSPPLPSVGPRCLSMPFTLTLSFSEKRRLYIFLSFPVTGCECVCVEFSLSAPFRACTVTTPTTHTHTSWVHPAVRDTETEDPGPSTPGLLLPTSHRLRGPTQMPSATRCGGGYFFRRETGARWNVKTGNLS